MAARPLIVFAHGAGAPSSSAWMKAWTARLGAVADVVAFDYPYMAAGRKAPDRLPVLVAAHRAAIAEARGRFPGPLVLAGKSMGSRVGCHVSLEEPAVRALVCFGYPLRSGATGALRDQVLVALRRPVLFLQGSGDALCPLDLLTQVRTRLTAPSEIVVVDGGNHSLEVPKRKLAAAHETQGDVEDRLLEAVRRFVGAHAS